MKVGLKTLFMFGAMLFVVTRVVYAPTIGEDFDAPEIPSGWAPYFLAGLTSGAFLIRRILNRRKDG